MYSKHFAVICFAKRAKDVESALFCAWKAGLRISLAFKKKERQTDSQRLRQAQAQRERERERYRRGTERERERERERESKRQTDRQSLQDIKHYKPVSYRLLLLGQK